MRARGLQPASSSQLHGEAAAASKAGRGGRACAQPAELRAAPGTAEEVPGKAGVSGTAGKRAARAAGEDEEGAGGTLPVLRVVPAVPRRHHPQVRGWERGGAGGQEGRTQGEPGRILRQRLSDQNV